MPADHREFQELVRQARAGDVDAVEQLAVLYEKDVRIAARVMLGPALRPYLDSVDILQSVHRSLLSGLRLNKFDFEGPGGLIALALTMVQRKVARQWRKHRRQRRVDEPLADVLATLNARAADPAVAVDIRDTMNRLCENLDAVDRQLLEMRLQGLTTAEAAHQLDHTPEALRIRLFRLRQRLRERNVATEWL